MRYDNQRELTGYRQTHGRYQTRIFECFAPGTHTPAAYLATGVVLPPEDAPDAALPEEVWEDDPVVKDATAERHAADWLAKNGIAKTARRQGKSKK